ncbi:UDP-glycosyltransferase UGT4 [Manduca sexta]|uniref:UDP-glycosyltransferase UGT4 n=1 Tax=Manduca sexta TaxID=7130 RepID=UPI00188F037C|nr:UDP-glycosyltransferase UGT4 [Manduca sexta]
MFREITLLILLSHNVFGFNILAMVSLPLRSHYMAFKPFFRELANRGHNVTVINNFPDAEMIPNMKFIDIEAPVISTLPTMDYYETISSSFLHLNGFMRHLPRTAGYVRKDCETILKNEKIKQHMESNKYDVIFVELFESDCGLAFVMHMSEAPVIGIKSHVLLPTAYPQLGLPFNFASDPYYRSNMGANPPLRQKLENYVINLLEYARMWYINRMINQMFKEHFPYKRIELVEGRKERLKMVFAYQHFSVTGARLLAPQLLEIGGIHVGKPKPVPKDIETFLANAKHGAIYVSFGTYLKPYTMSEKKLQQFLSAFRQMPYTFIWKIDNITIPEGYNNIHIGSWWPQLDILCHPKVLGFVSHGGMLSISEAAHCAKPMITMPFFGDQFSNSAAVRNVGMGKTLYLSDVTAENLVEAVYHLTSNEMQQNARRVSRMWHDRPQPVMDSAIYWTEYVARHVHAPPSLPSKFNTWFENSLLDVYAILLLVLLAVFIILYLIFKICKLIVVMLFKMVFRPRKNKKE